MAAVPTLVPIDQELIDQVAWRIYAVPKYSTKISDLAIWYWYVPDILYVPNAAECE